VHPAGRWIVALTSALVACTGTPPSPKTAPAPASGRGAADSARALALTSAPRYATGRESFQIATTGTVVVVGDTSGHLDTVSTKSVVRYDSRWTATGLEVTGSVASGAGSTLVPFSAMVDTATASVRLTNDSGVLSCPAANGAALATVREFLSAVPRSLAPGATWSDTVTTVTCRGGIPVTTTARRRFSVTLDGAVVLVEHTTSAELHGTKSSVELSGHGEGRARQHYQVETGRLLDGTSKVDIDLHVGTPGHLVALKQHAETQVTPSAAGR
jgi:hypothetical protein